MNSDRFDSGWCSTLVTAWHQESEQSSLVIRMINRFDGRTDTRCFASIEEATSQLRDWLKELEDNPPDSGSSDGNATVRRRS